MSEQTAIEWTDSTFNPWRLARVERGAEKSPLRPCIANWRKPIRWNARLFYQCTECGWRGENLLLNSYCPWNRGGKGCGSAPIRPARRRVFCASFADVFDNEVPQDDMWALIRETPNLDWILLTKCIGNVSKMLPADWGGGYPNVWLGATICNQAEADRDIPKLLAVPAAVRFLSIEPMLGPINFRWTPYAHQSTGETYREYLERNGKVDHLESLRRIDWVICGGESGPHARPMHPDWARSLRDQCALAGVPFFMKQLGGQRDKRAAGRLLDGREHNEFPVVIP